MRASSWPAGFHAGGFAGAPRRISVGLPGKDFDWLRRTQGSLGVQPGADAGDNPRSLARGSRARVRARSVHSVLLRRARRNVTAKHASTYTLKRLPPRLCGAFPGARWRIRLHAGISRPESYAFFGAPKLEYVMGMAKNAGLKFLADPLTAEVRCDFEAGQQTSHRSGESFTCRSAGRLPTPGAVSHARLVLLRRDPIIPLASRCRPSGEVFASNPARLNMNAQNVDQETRQRESQP